MIIIILHLLQIYGPMSVAVPSPCSKI